MRVVVSIKAAPGGGNASQAARYIAYRDRDEFGKVDGRRLRYQKGIGAHRVYLLLRLDLLDRPSGLFPGG